MLHTERLRALAEVARRGSIAAAARGLHVTPSGVSQQLAKLEREAGHRLLEPDGRGVRLTHAGHVLAAHAATVLAALTAAEADLADLHSEVLGPLRIGAIGSAVRTLLPPALAELTRRHPRLRPSVSDGEVVQLVPALLADELDLLVVESWSNRPRFLPEALEVRRLVRERVDVALAATHPLADRGDVTLAELAGTPWASCPPGTEPYEALVQAARDQGTEPRVDYTFTEFPSMLALAAADLAAALVPELARRPAPEGLRFVPVRPPLHRELQVVWRAEAASPPVRACAAALRRVAGADDTCHPADAAGVTGALWQQSPGADASGTPRR